ncbi:retrovirus-related pol polyprotein from transposon TNT 1-94, partial [Tanacetum coccineum]
MTGQRDKLINFVTKFIGTIKFDNDHFAAIMGYEDLQIENILISWVYYVEGLGHNLFSVGQFCDSDLEVVFRKYTCFVRNLEGVDLLSESHGSNLYTISMDEMMKLSPICLLSKASKTKSWLWYCRLSQLNFRTINQHAKQGLVKGLPTLKYAKDHLCSTCQMGSKKESHKPKPEPSTNEKLQILHMDLCGSMRMESINGKKYILVIVDDYSRFTKTHVLSKSGTSGCSLATDCDCDCKVGGSIDTGGSMDIKCCNGRNIKDIMGKNGLMVMEQAHLGCLLGRFMEVSHEGYLEDVAEINCMLSRWLRVRKLLLLLSLVVIRIVSGHKLQSLTSGHISSGLVPNSAPSTSSNPPSTKDILFQPMFDEYLKPPPSVVSLTLSTDTNVEDPNQENEDAEFDNDKFTNLFTPPNTSSAESSSSRIVDNSNMHTFQQPHSHIRRWTKDHPLVTIIGNPSKPIESMQEEIHEFERLEVWELVPRPSNFMLINLEWIFKVKLDEHGGCTYRSHSHLHRLCCLQEYDDLLDEDYKFCQNPRGIFINQSKYALEMLKKYGLEQCDVVDTPMVERSKFDEDLKGTL